MSLEFFTNSYVPEKHTNSNHKNKLKLSFRFYFFARMLKSNFYSDIRKISYCYLNFRFAIFLFFQILFV